MTQISKKYIPPWTYNKILDIFIDSFIKINNKGIAIKFFDDFLTPTEKVMLSKRITCFYLLNRKISIREISDIIKLSTATVAKYSLLMKRNIGIKVILNKILKEENFLKLIDTIINEYLHPPGSFGTSWASAGVEKVAYEQRKRSPL